MAYYAVYCRSGFEEKIESILRKLIPDHLKEKIKGIVCPTATTQTVRESGIRRKLKRVSFNYIYVKVDHHENSIIPSDIYHFLKELPFVQKVFQNDIPKHEVKRFCEVVGSSMEESEIEIVVKSEREPSNEDVLTKINQIRHPERLKEAEKQLDEHLHQTSNLIDRLKLLLSRQKNHRVTFYKTQRYDKVRLPLSVLAEAVKCTKVDVTTLKKPSHFLSTLYRYFSNLNSLAKN